MDDGKMGKPKKKFSGVFIFILLFLTLAIVVNLTNFYYDKVQRVTLRTVEDLNEFAEKNSDRSFVTKQAKKIYFDKVYYTEYYFLPGDTDSLSNFNHLYYGIIDNQVYFVTLELPANKVPQAEIANFEKTVAIETGDFYQLYRDHYDEIASFVTKQGIDLSSGEYQVYPYLLVDDNGGQVILIVLSLLIITPAIIALIKTKVNSNKRNFMFL